MNVTEIRLATADVLRSRLAAIKGQRYGSWKELDALEREASSIRMELMVRARAAA